MDPRTLNQDELGLHDATDSPPGTDDMSQGDFDDAPDFKALWEEAERARADAESRLAQTETNAQIAARQQQMSQVTALWQQAERQAWANSEQMDPEMSKQYMANFYNERDKFTRDQARIALETMGVREWKNELANRYQLTGEEMQMLGDDPRQMELHAQHLRRTREQVDAVRNESGIANAANRGRERLQSGAGVPFSGGRSNSGRRSSQPDYELGTRDHLLALIEQGVI